MSRVERTEEGGDSTTRGVYNNQKTILLVLIKKPRYFYVLFYTEIFIFPANPFPPLGDNLSQRCRRTRKMNLGPLVIR